MSHVSRTSGRPVITQRAESRAQTAQTAKSNSARGYGAGSDFEPSAEDKAAQKSIDTLINSFGSKTDFRAYVKQQADEGSWDSELDKKSFLRGRNGLPSDAIRRVGDKVKKEYERLKGEGLSPAEIEKKLKDFAGTKLLVEEYNKGFLDQMLERLAELNPWKE